MHFNPHSIALARDVVSAEAMRGRLRAVAVESCPTRWNSTYGVAPVNSLLRTICDNEMQGAAEAGEEAGVRTILADQSIEDTGARVSQLFALTLVELLTPWNGGWSRIYDDLRTALAEVVGGDEGLQPDAILDGRLLLNAPLSLVRYPLAIVVKSPLFGLLLATLVYATTLEPAVGEETYVSVAGALGFSFLETIVLGRVLLVGLLEERNFVLARNVRKAMFANPGGSIVAVLGMAHCTGVAKLLKSSRIV